MMIHRVDRMTATATWLFVGRENSDDDLQRYVDSLVALRTLLKPGIRGSGLMFVERHNPAPGAVWRKRMAEASAEIGENCLYALVSESIAIRSVVTAINWLRPPRYLVSAFGKMEDAYAWIEPKRDRTAVVTLRAQMAEMRAEAERRR
jgi:hypothetical protein